MGSPDGLSGFLSRSCHMPVSENESTLAAYLRCVAANPAKAVILTVVVWIAQLFLFVRIFRQSSLAFRPRPGNAPPSAQVFVLGDIGRSPRMQYHALSIAKHGGSVQLIGYHESALLPALRDSPSVKVCALLPPPAFLRSKSIPFIVAGPLKVLHQIFDLSLVLLFGTSPAQWLIVQNPPSIPTLFVAWLACHLRNTKLVIDWHNYGWTILAGTRGARHPLVRISKLWECFFGRLAPHASLAVTHAMARQLKRAPYKIRTPIVALHDRPAAIFRPITTAPRSSDRAAFLAGIDETRDFSGAVAAGSSSSSLRLVVSSTSWTPDEDFSILLDALVQYGASPDRVPLLVVITGRGPQKAMYEAKIARLSAEGRLPDMTIRTAFLSFDNYARLLAAADLGICLHMSSSGVDLPMKVVDMFGAGLPVLAYSGYESFGELVREGVNGCGFETPEQLASGMLRLLGPDGAELETLRRGAVEEGARRWDEEWDEVVKPLLGFSKQD